MNIHFTEAVERLRVNDYPDWTDTSEGVGVSVSRDADFWTVVPAYLAELDATPVDVAWVRSMCLSDDLGWHLIGVQPNGKNVYLILFSSGWELRVVGEDIHIRTPTRGQVRTVCRMFGVELKKEGDQ